MNDLISFANERASEISKFLNTIDEKTKTPRTHETYSGSAVKFKRIAAALKELHESRWHNWPKEKPTQDDEYLVKTTLGDHVVVEFKDGIPDRNRINPEAIACWKYINLPQ